MTRVQTGKQRDKDKPETCLAMTRIQTGKQRDKDELTPV